MSFKLEILRESVSWAEKLEDYGAKTTARLDDKAQQTGGLAGLFLAAAFGFLKPDNFAVLSFHAKRWAAGMLLLIIALLLGCLGACLSVTWLRWTPMPISLSVLQKLTEDLIRVEDDKLTDSVQQNVYHDRLRIWATVLESRQNFNARKAKRLRIAQTLLAGAMLSSSMLLFLVVRAILR